MQNTFKKISLRGFTLIELLVVIAIIGLLSTVIAAPITQARKKGRDGKKVADLHQLVGALQQYADDHTGNYPVSYDGLTPTYLSVIPINGATTTAAKDKYLYVVYNTATVGDVREVGFHLGVKLEAPNLALGDDRDCHGTGTIVPADNFCQDSNADSLNAMDRKPGNISSLAAVNTGADFPNDAFGMSGGPLTFQAGDFQGGTDTASTSCTAMVKAITAGAPSTAGTCIYDITN